MYAKNVNVSKRGQVTIPKEIRKRLNIGENTALLLIVENHEIKLMAVPSSPLERLTGSLKEYADKYEPLANIREKIQYEIARSVNSEHERGSREEYE